MQTIEQVKLSSAWYLEHMPPLKAAFEDGMIIIPSDDDLLGDLALVRTISGIPQIPPIRTIGADGKKRHGDFAVALALAYAQTRADVVEFDYRGLASKASADIHDRPRHDDDTDRGARGEWWRSPLGARLRGSI
jgi:phage FluMu gp28-like protein